ncbi:MAG: hypothetical protein UT30_C0015G0008 [Candidatus Uhrbacteria bacterium GW2011_GWF2_39_13]|uniref:Trimethylamine methyltransferase n=1 Tax=Candidatus Uhrbacteria bacterium GW2011_GWF2_39_13 TaxID=1618995 RepID=A0A0G0QQP0_9BACT|nr:MAG: hypothetical protein UT30_C0015G0008 [Candidatus Uhrbacteria bacterium GW2011_GWF2_39_13]
MYSKTWFDEFALRMNSKSHIVEEFIDTSVKLLSELGVKAAHHGFLSRISKGDGFSVKGERVFFDGKYLRKLIEERRGQALARPEEQNGFVPSKEFSMAIGGYSFNTIDATGKQRPSTLSDLIELTKLGEVCKCSGPNPVFPQDIPMPMRDLAGYRYCFEYSSKIYGRFHFTNIKQGEYAYRITKAAGLKFNAHVCFQDALTINPEDLDKLLYFLDKNDKDVLPSCIAYHLPGITGPITPMGCNVLAYAENLAARIIFKHLRPDVDITHLPGSAGPANLKNLCWALGSSPSYTYYSMASLFRTMFNEEIMQFPSAVPLMTGSAAIDAQAITEKACMALAGALGGAKSFSNLGNLACDDINSVEQFVIDLDIIEFVKNHISSIGMLDDMLSLGSAYDTIKANVVDRIDFLMTDETLGDFKKFIKEEYLFDYKKAQQWEKESRNLICRASERARDLIRKHDYVCDQDRLKEIDNIYRKAEKELC